jgi:hypothetical protein
MFLFSDVTDFFLFFISLNCVIFKGVWDFLKIYSGVVSVTQNFLKNLMTLETNFLLFPYR